MSSSRWEETQTWAGALAGSAKGGKRGKHSESSMCRIWPLTGYTGVSKRGVETPRFLARDRVTGGATLRWFANGSHLSYQSYSPPFTPLLCALESRPVGTASPGFLGPLVSGRVWSLGVISKRLWWLASLITSMAAASTRQPFLHMQVKSPSWTFRSSADNSFPLWLQIPYWIC